MFNDQLTEQKERKMILRNGLFDATLEAGDDEIEISTDVVQSETYGPMLMGPLGPIGDVPMVRCLGKDAAGNSMFAPMEDADGNPLPQSTRALEDPDAYRGADYWRAKKAQLAARALARRDHRRWRKCQPKKRVG
jgi:hypothetical protein